jgi:hypothetical protein
LPANWSRGKVREQVATIPLICQLSLERSETNKVNTEKQGISFIVSERSKQDFAKK